MYVSLIKLRMIRNDKHEYNTDYILKRLQYIVFYQHSIGIIQKNKLDSHERYFHLF